MAAAAKAESLEDGGAPAPAAPAPAPKGGAGIGVIIAAVVASMAASGGIAWYLSSHGGSHAAAGAEGAAEGEHGAEAPKSPANYVSLDPSFVVNLTDDESQRYLQVGVEVMSRDAAAVDVVKLHEPRIRNALLMLLGAQHARDIATREGKEKLQAEVLAEVQRILTEETGKPGVDAVYFTSFVMQ